MSKAPKKPQQDPKDSSEPSLRPPPPPPETPETPTQEQQQSSEVPPAVDPLDALVAKQPEQPQSQTQSDGPPNPPKIPKEQLAEMPVEVRKDGVVGTPGARRPKPSLPTKIQFDVNGKTHHTNEQFLAVAGSLLPNDAEVWAHPNPELTERYCYAFGLPQMQVGGDFKVMEASRETVLEWIYVKLWQPLLLDKVSGDRVACGHILSIFMKFPSRLATLMMQRVICAAGRHQIGSAGGDTIDGIFGTKTRGAIYSELNKHFDSTRLALYAECYRELQSKASTDADIWGPIFQAFVIRHI